METELGSKVDPLTSEVCVDGARISLRDTNSYLMLNKPAGYLTTMSDPQGRPVVLSLLPAGHAAGLFPVGRLDLDTTGLLLFMTDGELAHQLLHPRHHVPKRYLALVEGCFGEKDAQRLRNGVELDDGMTKPAKVQILRVGQGGVTREPPPCSTLVAITISEGRKRQVKRMFAHVGHPVLSLHREAFGPLELGSLCAGSCRELTEKETAALKAASQKEAL
jgi:23S rRNA pseudouridine2605 synthase